MNNIWKKSSDDYVSSAKVVDGNLIISLPDAINPVVWRMELGSVKASALEVKAQADNSFMLALKTPKGEIHDIAPFETREQAVRALMRVSTALQGAHGKIAPAAAAAGPNTTTIINATEKDRGSALKWVLTLGGVLLVIFLFAYLSAIASQNTHSVSANGPTPSVQLDGDSGVPQSADQLLRGY